VQPSSSTVPVRPGTPASSVQTKLSHQRSVSNTDVTPSQASSTFICRRPPGSGVGWARACCAAVALWSGWQYVVVVSFRWPGYRGTAPLVAAGSAMSLRDYGQWRDERTWAPLAAPAWLSRAIWLGRHGSSHC
jgi:hypothetical protein